jgi:hypothetical protein
MYGVETGRTVSRLDVWFVIARRTYAFETRRTVIVWQGNPLFAKCSIALVFLDLGLL